MAYTLCSLLPRSVPAPEITEDLFIKTINCQSPRKCWEATGPFEGGSVAWEGTAGQKAVRREIEEAAKGQMLDCVWELSPEITSSQYSCTRHFDMSEHRPKCSEFTQAQKKAKQPWCWEPEGHLLPHGGKCEVSVFECAPSAHAHGCCPMKPRTDVPLFIWHDGYPFFNYGEASHPYLTEALRPPPTPSKPRDEVPAPPIPCRHSTAFDPCGVLMGGPGQRTLRRRAEAARDKQLYRPQYVPQLPVPKPRCPGLPRGGATRPPPPHCRPCACPR